MKWAHSLNNLFTKVSFILLVSTIYGCNPLKNIPENEVLLRKNEIILSGKVVKEAGINNLILQQPNTYIFGTPLKLNISNLSRDSEKDNWLNRIGETPVLIDQKSTAKSSLRLKSYYETLGYFNTEVNTAIIKHQKNQKLPYNTK